MLWQKVLYSFIYVGLVVGYSGCVDTKSQLEIDDTKLSANALNGKKIFENENCAKCHSLGKEVITVVHQRKEVIVPNLSDPFIAKEKSFVQAHFKLIEESDMPHVELTQEEIDLVSQFVAELHAAANATVSADQADTKCPVCGAPVLMESANQNEFWISYLDSTYYFECEACKETFNKAPEAFRTWHSSEGTN